MNEATTVIVYGPQGSGKTINRRVLAARFGCEAIVDDWTPVRRMSRGALHLTCVSPHCIPRRQLASAHLVIDIRTALRLLGDRMPSPGRAQAFPTTTGVPCHAA